jgi:hypothetical protein
MEYSYQFGFGLHLSSSSRFGRFLCEQSIMPLGCCMAGDLIYAVYYTWVIDIFILGLCHPFAYKSQLFLHAFHCQMLRTCECEVPNLSKNLIFYYTLQNVIWYFFYTPVIVIWYIFFPWSQHYMLTKLYNSVPIGGIADQGAAPQVLAAFYGTHSVHWATRPECPTWRRPSAGVSNWRSTFKQFLANETENNLQCASSPSQWISSSTRNRNQFPYLEHRLQHG